MLLKHVTHTGTAYHGSKKTVLLKNLFTSNIMACLLHFKILVHLNVCLNEQN